MQREPGLVYLNWGKELLQEIRIEAYRMIVALVKEIRINIKNKVYHMKKLSQISMLIVSMFALSTYAVAEEAAAQEEAKAMEKKVVTLDDPRFKVSSEWNLESDEDGIQTYTKYLEGMSLRAFKVVTTVDAPLPQTLMFLNDSTQFDRWINMLKSAEILQQTDPNGVSYNHMITQVPWPIRNRDVVVKATIVYDEEKDEVIITSDAAPTFIPDEEGLVRIHESSAKWQINRLSNGTLRLELTSHAEPGGNIPKWLANMVVLQLPKYMFSRLPQILESDEVKNLEFDSIQIFGKEVQL